MTVPVKTPAQGFSGDLSFTNQLLWRGVQLASSPLFYPTIRYITGGLDIYTTAAYALDDSCREWDFGFSYTWRDFRLEVIDYFYPAISSEPHPEAPQYDFFNWNNATTGHQIDCILYYEPKSVPIKAFASVLPFGNDRLADGRNAFSTYAEIGWYHNFEDESRVETNFGASFRESPIYLTEGFGFVNAELKYGKIFDCKSIRFPLAVSFVFNQYVSQPYIVASTGLSF